MTFTMFSERKPKRPPIDPMVLFGGVSLTSLVTGLPLLLIRLPEDFVHAPAVYIAVGTVALLLGSFVIEHLLRTWSIELGKSLLIFDWGIVGPFRRLSKDVLAEARLHDAPLRVELLDHHGNVLVTLGPWDPDSFWGSSRTRNVCERFVRELNASRTSSGDHARL